MEKIPFLYRMIRGAVGRRLVVKHYRGGRVVVTRFPDMSRIVASARQRVRRDLFREAVGFARWVIGEEGRKLAFKNMLPRKRRRKVYQAALQMYMQKRGDKRWVGKVVGMLEVQGVPVDARGKLAVAAEEWARGNRQWAIGKGESAMAKKVNGEWSMGKGVYKQLGPWRVVWQKGTLEGEGHRVARGGWAIAADGLGDGLVVESG